MGCLLMNPIQVEADTTEDLLNVYGMTLGGPIRSELEKEIEEAEKELSGALFVQHEAESYNRLIEQYLQERERKQSEIIISVNSYLKQMDINARWIEDNLLTGDITNLLKLDSNYKQSNSYADTLVASLDYYQSYYSYKEVDVDVSGIVDRVYAARRLYSDSIDAASIGDVTNIRFPMSTERNVTSSYGMRIDPVTRMDVRFHAGTDYAAAIGTEVYSLFSGEVISTGWSDTIGYFATVQSSENIKFLICHCSEILVQEGDYVNQYDIIAYSGDTGSRCTGPHLHLALYINGVSYDVDELFK